MRAIRRLWRRGIRPESERNMRTLRLTQLALAVVLLGFLLAGRSFKPFPIVTWPMFSTLTSPYPGPVASQVDLRVVDSSTGRVRARLNAAELVSLERNLVALEVIEHAFLDEDLSWARTHRAYLLRLVRIALPGVEIDSVEAWETAWEVEPLRLPPLTRDRPARQTLLGVVHPSR